MPESDATCEQPSPPVLSLKDFFVRLDSRDVRCSECSVLYKRRKGLAAHMSARRASPKFSELYRCVKCCMVLPNHCSFRAHARIHDKLQPYVCPECGMTFRTTRDIFMTHVKRVCLHFSRFEGRKCPVCSAALTQSAESMVAHLENAHAASYHKCDRCSLVFPTEKSFDSHNVAQHDDSATFTRLRKCPVCNAAKKESESLSEHLREHVSQDGEALRCFFRCLVCRKCFSARTDLVDHMHSEHPSDAICGRMCSVCGAVCENGATLYAHTNTQHLEFMERLRNGETTDDEDKTPGKTEDVVVSAGVKPEMGSGKSLECDRCQMVLSDEEQFKRHVAKHRFLEGKRAGGKMTETKAKKKQRREGVKDVVAVVDNDVKIKTEKVEDEVPATPDSIQSTPLRSSCSTSTATSPRSENPPSSDSSDKDLKLWFSCHLCVKTFKNTNDLNQHLKDTHAGKSRLHAYLCWICREQSELKSYPKAGMLIKHLKNYHKITRKNIDYARIASFDNKDEEDAIGEDDKPVVCEAPSQVRNLRVEGDATYNCAKCEYSSTERGEFREHVARHRLNESHQCLECGVCFVAVPSLKRHLFVVHRVRDFARYQNETGISLDLPAEPDSEPESFASPSADAESNFLSEVPGATLPEKESESALECTVCYRSFADEWTLRQHMRVHGMAFIQGTRRNNMSRKTAVTDS